MLGMPAWASMLAFVPHNAQELSEAAHVEGVQPLHLSGVKSPVRMPGTPSSCVECYLTPSCLSRRVMAVDALPIGIHGQVAEDCRAEACEVFHHLQGVITLGDCC